LFEDEEKTKPIEELISIGNIKSGFKYNDSLCLVQPMGERRYNLGKFCLYNFTFLISKDE
jgi:hypothetical protein